VVQQCFRTHAARIKRHNNNVSYLERSPCKRGYTVSLEPIYKLSSGVLKPDVVATKDGVSTIVDAQIVGDSVDLGEAHVQKVLKYSNQDLLDSVKSLTDASEVRVTSCTKKLARHLVTAQCGRTDQVRCDWSKRPQCSFGAGVAGDSGQFREVHANDLGLSVGDGTDRCRVSPVPITNRWGAPSPC
jgi:hypothetical protein